MTRAAPRAALVAVAWVLFMNVMTILSPAYALRRETMTLMTAQGERQISVEITESDLEKARGLMFRTKLGDDEGMLFFYDRPLEITMWMRNTYIPLDMVFIRPDGVVQRIVERTEPFSEAIISSMDPVIACLELAGGAAERLGLKVGDRIGHKLFKPAQ